MAIELHEVLRAQLGPDLDRAWFVPVGGIARSGAFVAYLFRSLNRISDGRFLSYDAVAEQVRDGAPIILLDDLPGIGSSSRTGRKLGRSVKTP
jgi:hypothetical protein